MSEAEAWAGLPPGWDPDSRFDGGETGCGEVLLDLRIHFRGLSPGTRVAILVRDQGAPIEIPSWCRLTGHELLAAEHPYYLARVRAER